jgi:hypothetical protein
MKTGIKSDSLIKSCVQFFEKRVILEAKKVLYDESGYDERCIRQVKEEDNVIDIGRLVTRCAKNRKILPKFAI